MYQIEILKGKFTPLKNQKKREKKKQRNFEFWQRTENYQTKIMEMLIQLKRELLSTRQFRRKLSLVTGRTGEEKNE